MTDREKVIKGLECCMSEQICKGCPYKEKGECENGGYYYSKAIEDALSMLKEQEAVKPEREYSGGGTTWWNVCGACRTAINPNDKYCHECGRTVKWE